MRKLGDAPTAVKSVTGDTPVVLLEAGKPKYVRIGDWIDRHLDARKSDVAHFTERQMELLQMPLESIYIPTTDEHGHVTWGEITAITRHDPGTELYKITTQGGRSVIVTESKSLLTWNEALGQFKEVPTPDIKLGDCVPVTMALQAPPVIVSSVDMASYFPKSKYIHGTDFYKACEMMTSDMSNRQKIPAGWWEKHNGTIFTLPYDSKAKLARVLARSCTDNIETGYIYPFHATREHGRIPDTFQLNRENGEFVGLFLAEGNACIQSGTVQITNMDEHIKTLTKLWFDRHGLTHVETTKTNAIGGTTSGVIGYSRMLAQFLTEFVGHGARHKYVPDAAFVAPEEFVVGILSGYFSGDGTVTKNSIESGSASPRLTEGIAMLCSRLGIFAKVFVTQTKRNNLGTEKIAPSHRIAIRAQWAQVFVDKVPLLVKLKQEQLESIRCSKAHRNFQVHHDVVLDPIQKIEILNVADYPEYSKVYDLTIPSTLNFGLANGLQVRDTSDTGYIQRKLVKAMEDCKVYYDLSVRNASGSIIQFYYGEDGMDASKIEHQPLPSINMDLPTLRREFLITAADVDNGLFEGILTKATLEDLEEGPRGVGQWDERMAAHFRQILEDRTYFITQVFKNKNKDSLMYPIAFQRILTAVKQRTAKALGGRSADATFLSDLHPAYVLDTIERLQKTLTLQMRPDSDDPATSGTYLLHALLRLNLSPKRLLFKFGLDKDGFDFVVQKIQARFYESLAHPSEMVGVIAAQSIGEPCTQLTLNTFHSAGISAASTAVRGVPRLRELLSVTKNMKTPIMKIYVSPDASSEKTKCMELANELRTVRFKDIVESCKIYFDPCDGGRTLTNIEEDRAFMQLYEEFRMQMGGGGNGASGEGGAGGTGNDCQDKTSPWLLRLEFNKAKMLQFKISMLDVHRALGSFYDWCTLSCVFSDDNADKLIFRVRLKIDDEAACDDMLTELRALEHNILETVTIKGVKSIEKVSMHEEKDRVAYRPEDGTFVQAPEWVIDTQGSNLIDVLGCPFVDSARTTTNNVPEIYQILGVEAARMALFNEITDVLDQVYVDYRHIALLVDTMTNKGNLLSIDRHGINRGDIGPLAKCSFEEVNDMLVKAGIFAEADKINGVSANIILGQIAPCGTGDGAILMDESMLEEGRDGGDSDEEDDEGRDLMDMEFERPQTADAEGTDACAWTTLSSGFNDFKLPEPDEALQKRFVVAAQ